MEKQRSFSIKPTRFMVFSFTVSFSLTLLAFFSIWVIHSTPILHQEPHFDLGSGHDPVGDFSSNSSHEVKNAIFIGTQLIGSVNTSGFSNFSRTGSDLNDTQDSLSHLNGSVSELISSVLIAPKQSNLDFDGVVISGNALNAHENGSESLSGKVEVSKNSEIQESSKKLCDVTKGKWVFDDSYPLYTNVTCPFIDEGFSCQSNGRLDKDYMKWRWQPQHCDIPRFNATAMLNLIRGKRLVFVGDSINRNQWESMLCLLVGAIKDPKRVYEAHGRRITKEKGNYCFKFLDYKCTVEFYVSHYLVHEGKARVGKKRLQTLRIDTMDRGASRWKGADIIVFNTAHWWSHYKTKSGVNYYQEGQQVYPRLDVSTAFQKALMTWGSWLDKYINPQKTQVFFRNSAPSHFRGGQWNAGGHCREASQPVNETSRTTYYEKNIILEEVLKQMKIPVTILNITGLSDYRVDGHPSVYGRRPGKSSSGGQDCSHWCLPGVPDTWNELLYFYLQSNTRHT
ncbi:hypothetical protein DCAR_0313987 [Daucus carota subsp. sativus]|uniref:Trichome birefringence-like N-terminal domain-containing protein n=1 Tax=Daucus carota subsp. sativus TaxID=79200 RepID=A0AAF0WV29_DAUCS|nr:PREDICTED: protein trichome birefringence-like 6 [Daucus carota subsp. sativus]WOG94690.1 hypothetical protein DCAR_0313987 [Daucus carota subsp. sativus]